MNKHAVGKDWLDASQFPKMKSSRPLKFEGDTPKELHGSSTLKGITKPVRLKTEFQCMQHPFYKKEACGADAEGQWIGRTLGCRNTPRTAWAHHAGIQVEGADRE